MATHLLIDYYVSPNPDRKLELDLCYKDNIKNPSFDKIHVFTNDEVPESNEKVVINSYEKRLTYRDYFEYAKNNIPKDDIIVLSNSDMFFDSTITKVSNYDLDKHVLTLTRWSSENHYDPTDDGHSIINNQFIPFKLDYCSQDVWVFKNPLKNIEKSNCDFTLGVLGCDNKIAYAFSEMGYIPLNPSVDILTYHNHATGNATRTYERVWLPRPYLFVPTVF